MRSTTTLLTVAVLCVSCSSYLGETVDAAATADDAAGAAAEDAGVATLVIADPAASLDGYSLFAPDEKRNNPSAGTPAYVYLHAGTEAVVIAGPDVANADGLFALMNSRIGLVGATDFSADGYTVVVNSRLAYQVAIDDFEYEVTLARVELSDTGQSIQSRFIFSANPTASGVAHDIAITATGAPALSATPPVTVEVR